MNNTETMRKSAFKILNTLTSAGFEAYIVGGAVRNFLLNMPAKDFDITTNATPEQVTKLFQNTSFVGAAFGVSLIKIDGFDFEIATYRTDGVYNDNRHPENVSLTLNVKEDILRRDFTCNAILMDENENIHDLVGGQKDIKQRILRCVGDPNERFNEDALRMLRAIRFCCQLGFIMDSNTFEAIRVNKNLVKNISVERIQIELNKMLTSGYAEIAFDLLNATGLMNIILPEICELANCDQDSKWHPEGNVSIHTRLLLNSLEKDCSLTLALSALLHDIAKPATHIIKNGKIHSYGHEIVGEKMAEEILHRLKYSNDIIKVVCSNVRNHMKFYTAKNMKRSKLIRFVKTENFDELLKLNWLDINASNKDFSCNEFVKNFITENKNEIENERFITGNDLISLGFIPGPDFKNILNIVETKQFEGRIHSKEDAINFLKKKFPRKVKQ